MKLFLFILTGFVFFHHSHANDKSKEPKRILSLTQFVDEMKNAVIEYKLTNAIIRFNPETDANFELAAENQPKKTRITAVVILRNLIFEGGINITFANMVFEESFRMYDCQGVEPYYLFFDYNQFKNGLDMRRNRFYAFGITHCTFYNYVTFKDQRVDRFYLETSTFSTNITKLKQLENKSIIPPYFFLQNSAETSYFWEVRDCNFNYRLSKGLKGLIIMRECYFSNFVLLNSNFNVPLDLTDATYILLLYDSVFFRILFLFLFTMG